MYNNIGSKLMVSRGLLGPELDTLSHEPFQLGGLLYLSLPLAIECKFHSTNTFVFCRFSFY